MRSILTKQDLTARLNGCRIPPIRNGGEGFLMEVIMGWGLTMGCALGIITLPKDYVPVCVVGMVVGALLIQGGI